METFLIYIGKTALAVGAFYLTFYFLFRTQSLFRFNRFYLLSSFLISFIIPLITFTVIKIVIPSAFHQNTNYEAVLPSTEALVFSPVKDNLDISLWGFYIYLIGVGISIIHLIIGHIRAKSLISKSYKEINYSTEFCVSKEDIHPFSFFNKIIVPKKILTHPNLDLIIQHENVHVKEKHTLDMLLSELLFTFQWFNPFAWLIKDAIKTNLEYIADEKVVQENDLQTYQLTMVSLADKKGIAPFLTALNGSQLKNRIIMMKQKTENKFPTLKRIALIPLLALLVMGLSTKEVKTEIISLHQGQEQKTTIAEDQDSIPNKEDIIDIIKKHGDEEVFKGNARSDILDNLPQERPLFVADGIVKETEVDKINKNSIEGITVLKDKSAETLYGTKGKNGVVLITTKKGLVPSEFKKKINQEIIYLDKRRISSLDQIPLNEIESFNSYPGDNALGGTTSMYVAKTNTGNKSSHYSNPLYFINGRLSKINNIDDLEPNLIGSITVDSNPESLKKYGAKENDVIFWIEQNNIDVKNHASSFKPEEYVYISGKVISEEDKSPVANALITVTGISDPKYRGTLTNKNGEFSLEVDTRAHKIVGVALGKNWKEYNCKDLSSDEMIISLSKAKRKDIEGISGIYEKFYDYITSNNKKNQNNSISGKVTDEYGNSIPGVSVIIKGKTTGTITDEEGNFMITVEPDDYSLIFAHQGFTRKEVKITDKPSIVVKLGISEKESSTPKDVDDKKIEQEKWKRTIYGKVSDKKTGEPIPNASVLIKGERIGTITDQTGSYMIKIDDSDKNVILIFSNIGYDINETKIQNKDEVNVTLKKNE